jgi:rhodanese-related sulfurtransferase
MKKLIIEISVVLSIAVLIAVAYNLFSSKPLPWITEKKEIKVVNDSLLFGEDSTNLPVIDTITRGNLATDTVKTDLTKKDTIRSDKEVEPTKAEKINKDTEMQTLTYEQIVKAVNNPKFHFIDARPPHEWEVSRIGNASNIYPYDENHENYFKLLTTQPKDKILIVYCSGGNCEASHKVVNDLKSFGYSKVFLYSGGWEDWLKHGGK